MSFLPYQAYFVVVAGLREELIIIGQLMKIHRRLEANTKKLSLVSALAVSALVTMAPIQLRMFHLDEFKK